MTRLNKIFSFLIIAFVAVVAATVVFAWTNPSGAPPAGGGALYYSNGNVGIGTTSPSSLLTVSGNARIIDHLLVGSSAVADLGYPAFYHIPFQIEETVSDSSLFGSFGAYAKVLVTANNTSQIHYGASFNAWQTGTGSLSALYGVQGYAAASNNESTPKTVGALKGVSGQAYIIGDNTHVTSTIGGNFEAATVFNMVNLRADYMIAGNFRTFAFGSGDNDIDNMMGVRIQAPGGSSTGNLGNLYGLYIEDHSNLTVSGDNFNIYSAGANSKNYFAGNVGIGTANPGAKLDVAGSIRFQSAAMSSPEDLILKSLAAIYTQGLGGAPVYHYWNDAAGQTCTTKCSNMGHTCIAAFAVHQSYVSMPGCGYNGTAGLACLCNP